MQFAGATVVVNRGVEIVGGGVTDTQPVNKTWGTTWHGLVFRINTEFKNIYIQSPILYHTCNVNKHTQICTPSVDVQTPRGGSVCSSERSHRSKTVCNIL